MLAGRSVSPIRQLTLGLLQDRPEVDERHLPAALAAIPPTLRQLAVITSTSDKTSSTVRRSAPPTLTLTGHLHGRHGPAAVGAADVARTAADHDRAVRIGPGRRGPARTCLCHARHHDRRPGALIAFAVLESDWSATVLAPSCVARVDIVLSLCSSRPLRCLSCARDAGRRRRARPHAHREHRRGA